MRKTLKIVTLCAVIGLGSAMGGFSLGKQTSIVDKVSFHEETFGGLSGFKAIRLHKPYAKDKIFIKRNGDSYWKIEDCFGEYTPMKKDLSQRYVPSVAQTREKDIKEATGMDYE